MRRHLVLFLRAPGLGRGKRRLAAEIGDLAALRFERLMIAMLLRRLAGDRRWDLRIVVTPDRASRQARHWRRRDRGLRARRRRSRPPHAPRARRPRLRPGSARRRRHSGARCPPHRRRLPPARHARSGLRPGRRWRVLAGRRPPPPAPAVSVRAGAMVGPATPSPTRSPGCPGGSRWGLSKPSKTSMTAMPTAGSGPGAGSDAASFVAERGFALFEEGGHALGGVGALEGEGVETGFDREAFQQRGLEAASDGGAGETEARAGCSRSSRAAKLLPASTRSPSAMRLTRPIASASSAATARPVRIMSSARASPISRGRRWVPP